MISDFLRELRNPWVLFGFGAQFLFFLRFFVQWLASERRGKSYIPVIFWWFSLAGGSMLFVYACQRRDPVFIAGQGLGCLIYIRNLILIYRRQARLQARKSSRLELLMSDGLSNARDTADGPSTPRAPVAHVDASGQEAAPSEPRRSTAHVAE
ncbi:MAG: lipid-A-disaccharide synthase N-terminal domain-containing protein [Phycisphaerales bacterium]|nr:MAG: lipid-A-disaccharide synthase N-terminal domain-containing protein [Phycisphaerales bacterium]